ncbi:MAG TPA: hypothetical protein PKY56_10345, partial [Candidatus Kapabacteria bacterium]|nr:hypothetical protein [Candidatus Kapabacteria bacterium]HPO62589.1 hypothetical protein [Candidatus Kapabacteria bacterium]
IVLFTNIYAQDKEPVQHKFYFPAYSAIDSVYLSDTLDFFKQDKFMLGWHWGASFKISKALNINQHDAYSSLYTQSTNMNDSILLFVKSENGNKIWTHCDNGTEIVRSKSIYYEPTLQINTANMSVPNSNNYDDMNPIFGFKKVLGTVENLGNRSRLVLDNAYLNGLVVLEGLNYKNIYANYDIFL